MEDESIETDTTSEIKQAKKQTEETTTIDFDMIDEIKLDTNKTNNSTSNTISESFTKTETEGTATSASDMKDPVPSKKKKVLNDESLENEEMPV